MSFLFVDRILELIPGERSLGIKQVTQDDFYLYKDCHEVLCFIPSFIGESLGQLTAWNVMFSNDFRFRPVAGIVSCARFYRSVVLGETILLESYIDSLDEQAVQYHSIARVGGETVFTVEGALGPLLPMDKFISDEEVRSQFSEIYRPGVFNLEPFTELEAKSCQDKPSIYGPILFDRILESKPQVSLVAEKRIEPHAPYFCDHFPKNPVFPMTVLLECQLNLAKEFLKRASFAVDYQISEFRKIKMNDFVYPKDVLICYMTLLQQDAQELILRTRCEVEGKRVCVVDVVMKAKAYDTE